MPLRLLVVLRQDRLRPREDDLRLRDELVDIDDVGYTCAYLATPYARRLTGQTMYVDGGVNIMA